MNNSGFTNQTLLKRLSNHTKSKANSKLLKEYNVKVEKRFTDKGSESVVYVWQYGDWRREYTRTWSMIDHVRMHEGLRPYQCSVWARTYTQKGNMLKHMRRHKEKEIKDRKKFPCELWNKKYTEKYNLKVRF